MAAFQHAFLEGSGQGFDPLRIASADSERAHGRKHGRAARDEAIERVAAPDDAAAWIDHATAALMSLLALKPVLSSDDVWAELERLGIEPPDEPRAMGPVMLAAVRAGHMRPLGFVQSARPVCNARPVRTYRSLLCAEVPA